MGSARKVKTEWCGEKKTEKSVGLFKEDGGENHSEEVTFKDLKA